MENKFRPLSALLHQAIATGNLEKVQELLKEGACVNTPLYLNEHMVEKVKRASKSNSIASRLSTTSALEPINESGSNIGTKSNMEQRSFNLIINDNADIQEKSENTLSELEVEDENLSGNKVKTTGCEEMNERTETLTITSNSENEVMECVMSKQDESPNKADGNEEENTEYVCNENFIVESNETVESSNAESNGTIESPIESNETREKQEVHQESNKTNENEHQNEHQYELDVTKDCQTSGSDGGSEEQNKVNNCYEDPVQEDNEAVISSFEPMRGHSEKTENNNLKSVADTINERLRDHNETLIERAPSILKKTDESEEVDKSPMKILPRIKRKLSLKWRNRAKTKEKDIEEEDGLEEYYENVPKARNVDDEQLNENYEGVAFFEAVREGMDMIVQTLLETSNNYQLDLPDENGFTPAMQAAWHAQKDCLLILLEHGADIRQQNAAGCAAAHFAAGQGHYECLELLLQYSEANVGCGSIANSKTKFGATPLILASKSGHKECVELLLQHGADPNIQYRGNQNALLFAAGNGHYECIQALLKYNVHINQTNSQNVSPLMRAVQQGHNTCVVLLIDHGADLDLQDSIGRTAVHFAVEHKNPKALKILIEAGASIDVKTKGGSTPVTYAERFQSVKCAEILENHINELKELAAIEQAKPVEIPINEKKEVEKQPTCGLFKNIFQRKKRVVQE